MLEGSLLGTLIGNAGRISTWVVTWDVGRVSTWIAGRISTCDPTQDAGRISAGVANWYAGKISTRVATQDAGRISTRFMLPTVAISRDEIMFDCKSEYSPKHVAPADEPSLTASDFLGWGV